jgi:hypothetical protein
VELDRLGGPGAESRPAFVLSDSDYYNLVDKIAHLSNLDFVALFQGAIYRRQVERRNVAKA